MSKFNISDPDFTGTIELSFNNSTSRGYCSINIPTCKVYDIAVNPRRKGLGRELLSKSEEVLKKHGCTDVYLYSLPGTTEFYKKCGYKMDSDAALSPSIVKLKKEL